MKKAKQKSKTMKPIAIKSRVTMTELDGNLSELVNYARKIGPVTVERYEVPWISIVQYATWNALSNLKNYIPGENHPVVQLRNLVDELLSRESIMLNELSQKCAKGIDPKMVIRAIFLQIVYSAPCAARVYERLGYNMLWRWFVGYTNAIDRLPNADAFISAMVAFSRDHRVVTLVHRCISENGEMLIESCEFNVNFGLLHMLRDQCKRADDSELKTDALSL